MKFFEQGDEQEHPRPVFSVADGQSLSEALERLEGGETIQLQDGCYNHVDKWLLHKPVRLVGAVDEATGSPATILTGRFNVSVPPAEPWRGGQEQVTSFRNIHFASESGYCCEVVQGEVQMYNCKVVCERGTAMMVDEAAVGLHACFIGSEGGRANYGLQVGDKGEVWATDSTLAGCKTGVLLKDRSVLKLHRCYMTSMLQAFGCLVPNEAVMEVSKTTLTDCEFTWHRNSRPCELFQQENSDANGNPLRLHGRQDGRHSFRFGELDVKEEDERY